MSAGLWYCNFKKLQILFSHQFYVVATIPSWMLARQSNAAQIATRFNTSQIVGGQTAPSPIPWQVSVRDCTSGFCTHWCGGIILDERTVLSAAHCYYGKSTNHYIRAGVVNKNSAGQVSTIYAFKMKCSLFSIYECF